MHDPLTGNRYGLLNSSITATAPGISRIDGTAVEGRVKMGESKEFHAATERLNGTKKSVPVEESPYEEVLFYHLCSFNRMIHS